MSDQLLLVLRICLLALVYLTFFRVLRAVWVELRTEHRVVVAPPVVVPAASAAPVASAPPAPPAVGTDEQVGARLVMLAPASLAGAVFDLQSETTIGRAPGFLNGNDIGKVPS